MYITSKVKGVLEGGGGGGRVWTREWLALCLRTLPRLACYQPAY
jgi:hypothetical protein